MFCYIWLRLAIMAYYMAFYAYYFVSLSFTLQTLDLLLILLY